MSEEVNPNRPPDSAADELAQALEELIETRESGNPAPVSAAAGEPASGLAQPSGCPDPAEWTRLASGEAGAADVDSLLVHAAFCPGCAARLRLSLRLSDDEPSPEEAVELGALAAVTSAWQRRLAGQLARSPRQSRRKAWPAWYVWSGAGLAASLALAAALILWWQVANTPERLLAETYGHARIFALRFPGAAYADVTPETHLRGSATGREPAKLLDARARIASHLERTPQDPRWLQLQARADVLEEQFDPAIDILDRLLAAGPVTSSLLTDDAAAYFQRGIAIGSENDRATALDYLRRADELAPGDTVVLFNEAVAMEDRGQVMNAVETWNRYLRFERDPNWLAEGRRRLQALEQKLNRMKTHQSRMEQHLATPQAMRSLAADPAALAAIDEELSSTLLPRLLDSAFPLPVDRSRGSPCGDNCQAARTLLHALAASLELNHQDPWLTRLLPSESKPSDSKFNQAAHDLGQAIDADVLGEYSSAGQWALKSSHFFRSLRNPAGTDRAEVERAYALQRSFHLDSCHRAAKALLGRNLQFAWIQIHALTVDGICDAGPGTASENNPSYPRAIRLSQDHHYALLELRARNMLGAAAIESGDTEDAWRIDLASVRRLQAGDFPAFRTYTAMAGLGEAEESTPRIHLSLLIQQEASKTIALTQRRNLISGQRLYLVGAAIRAGAIPLAQDELSALQSELAGTSPGALIHGMLAEREIWIAESYLSNRDLAKAGSMLDAARIHLAGDDDSVHRRAYAAARGELELALGHPETAESMLRDAILDEERQAAHVGAANVIFALQNRELYATLAGVWMAQGRSGADILALWERYRLRILGEPVPACPNRGLACLKPKLMNALERLGQDRLLGQVILLDHMLLYQASPQGVVWTSVPIGRDDLLAAAEPLERAVSSPATSQDSFDQAARRLGDILLGGLPESPGANGQILLEPDPALGNLPWPAVETAGGPIGLRFDVEETPSLLLSPRPSGSRRAAGRPLIVGASAASSEDPPLPEALSEANEVARFVEKPDLLLAGRATEAQISAGMETASAIHFAGHAVQSAGSTRLLLAPAAVGPDRPYLDSALMRKHPPRAARLVVFSACSTGKREPGWNHGMEDIVDTLASLGVPEVVATRWQIDSAAAVPMMDAFYGGLARGLSVPRALTAARLSLIRDVRYRHPYYWAAYYASGTGRTDLREVFHGISR